MAGDRMEGIGWISVGEARTVMDSPFFSLVAEMVLLPEGTRSTNYRYGDEREGRPPLVAVLAICRNARGEIALSSQWSHPLRRVHGEFPAGGVRENEPLEVAVLRELREETGIVGTNLRWIGHLHNDVRRSTLITYVCVVDGFDLTTACPESTEDAVWEWVTEASLDARVRSGRLTNASLLAAWCLYRLAAEDLPAGERAG